MESLSSLREERVFPTRRQESRSAWAGGWSRKTGEKLVGFDAPRPSVSGFGSASPARPGGSRRRAPLAHAKNDPLPCFRNRAGTELICLGGREGVANWTDSSRRATMVDLT
ncbi:hypothetical protein KM043_012346 [Ampulex compressa]|nr:hypothetical protein KM043_012346 [Ampulex compressa]